jgi:hypothetical protein
MTLLSPRNRMQPTHIKIMFIGPVEGEKFRDVIHWDLRLPNGYEDFISCRLVCCKSTDVSEERSLSILKMENKPTETFGCLTAMKISYHVVLFAASQPTCQRNDPSPSWRWKISQSRTKHEAVSKTGFTSCWTVFNACFMMVYCLVHSSTLKMEAKYSSEMWLNFGQTPQRYMPEGITYNHGCEHQNC